MDVIICKTSADAEKLAARMIADAINAKPEFKLGLATGATMENVYAELSKLNKEGKVDFSQVRSWNLDEYAGLAPEHDQSYRYYMNKHLFNNVNIDIRNTHLPDGLAADEEVEAARYDDSIDEAGGIDLWLVGIGKSGHVGFNDPGTSFASRTHVAYLNNTTYEQNKMYFNPPESMPRRAYTAGVGTVLDAKKVLQLITGERKAAIAAAAIEGPMTAMISSTALQLHPDTVIILDEAAAADLKLKDFYKEVFENDPKWEAYRGEEQVMAEIKVTSSIIPELDPGFVPAALWNREFRRLAAADANAIDAAITLERSNGAVSRFDTKLLPDTAENLKLNFRYVERIVKFMLWAYGGKSVTIAGAPLVAAKLAEVYSEKGERAFDYQVMGERIYGSKFEVRSVAYADAAPEKKISVKLGGNFSGCRIGFDLGGSDRKCAAVIDGQAVHSEEVVWDPYFQKDVNYHREGILDSLRRAAAKMPRIDAIGGSAAGVYVENQPRIASLFRGIPEADFKTKVQPIFLEIAKEFPGVPFVVLNDGEVTALAGAISLKRNAMIGLAMGTSEAVGYVTPDGSLTDYLNELAFAPVDYREDNPPCDEWSGDAGVGAMYLSQQAVGRLVKPAGFDIPEGTPLPEVLKIVQKARAENDPRASRIYRSVGVYLGYAIAHYADFYDLENLLLLGRVSSGDGGTEIIEEAARVLKTDFPELAVEIHIPDETFKRHGQAVIAASL